MRPQPATACSDRTPIGASRGPDPADEAGYALVLALGILVVLSISLSTAIYYASTSVREANYAQAGQSAFALAEAGVNDALSILSGSPDPTYSAALPSCTAPLTPTAVSTGSYTFCGSINHLAWTIRATGTARNPTGAGSSPVARTVTRTATLVPDPTVPAWDRIYDDDSSPGSSCWEVPQSTVLQSNVGARGDVCLTGASFTGTGSTIQIGGKLTMTSYPSAGSMLAYAHAGATTTTGAVWTAPENVAAPGYATATVPGGGKSAALDATNFRFDLFDLPANSVIAGITVQVYGMASAAGAVADDTVQLLRNGVPVGSSEPSAAAWGTALPQSGFGTNHGSPTDLWGMTGANAWTRDDVTSSGFGVRLVVKNSSAAAVLASVDQIAVTVAYTYAIDSSIGGAAGPVREADIAGADPNTGCKWNTQGWDRPPCLDTDHVYATFRAPAGPPPKPPVSFSYWYAHAAPGPQHPCDASSGPVPAFESPNNTVLDDSNPSREITPEGFAYSCIAADARGNRIGELSWDPATRVLRIQGTIFFDGPITFGDANTLVRYSGRGTIYASGTAILSEAICAGGSGTDVASCRTESFSDWDPAQNLLVLVVGGSTASGVDDCRLTQSQSAFQGAIWAQNECKISRTAYSSGPIIAQRVTFSNSNGARFFPWKPLGSALPGMSVDGYVPASGFTVTPGPQFGG